MKKFAIVLILIGVLVVTNLLTMVTSIGGTSYYMDYKWREYSESIEYNIFVAIHRRCVKTVKDNNSCNSMAKVIYRQYQTNYKPLPGFDWDFITDEPEKIAY